MAKTEALRCERTENLSNWYITAGDRAYLIGAQDGSFPDLGWHTKGEMGGLWTHPIKLLDGFWLQVNGSWLESAARYTQGPCWSEWHYTGLRKGLEVTRRQFVPDGEPAAVVRYTLRSPVDRTLKIRFLARIDMRGVWLSDEDGIRDGYDQARFDGDMGAWVCRDDLNPWRTVVGAVGPQPAGQECGRTVWGPEQTQGRGISVALDYTFDVTAGGTVELTFVAAGSHQGEDAAIASFRRVSGDVDGCIDRKSARYAEMLDRSALTIPDATIGAAWDWVKCDYDWLVRSVPEWGTGLGAGVQDYPWWFGCDNSYALFGCLALGQHEVVVQTLDLLRRLSLAWNGDSGQLVHECNTWGYAFNPGNAQEAPHFVKAVWHSYLWTGDLDFLRRNYAFCRQAIFGWLLGKCCRDGSLLPYGYGITEMEDLNLRLMDTSVYTVEALDALGQMARLLDEPDVAAMSTDLRDRCRAEMEDSFWMEAEGLYGDMLATPAEMVPRLRHWLRAAEQEGAQGRAKPPEVFVELKHLLHQAETDPEPDRKRPWQMKNWVIACPMEAGLSPADRAVRSLNRLETPEFTGRWGMYLSGIDHTHTMTINTGVLAVAEAAYGRVDKALEYSRKIAETLGMHMPGAIAEMSPDYGCFVQAWSGYGIAWPMVAQIFGLRPDAARRHLEIRAAFPASWPSAHLTGVRIGSNRFDFHWDGLELTVRSAEPGWTVTAPGLGLHLAE